MVSFFSSKKNILLTVAAVGLVLITVAFFINSSVANKASQINYAKEEAQISKEEEQAILNQLKVKEGEVYIGNKNAKVVMTAYDSFSCNHCANFYENTFPLIETNYIQTGKILFVHRDFPLDSQALMASKLTKCFAQKQGNEKAFKVILATYLAQRDWLSSSSPENTKLKEIFKFAGMSENEVSSCLLNKDLEKKILEERLEASKKLKILGTPTFFINGKKLPNSSYNAFAEEIEKLLN